MDPNGPTHYKTGAQTKREAAERHNRAYEMNISKTMLDAIYFAKQHGGKLHRHPGGYWMQKEFKGRWQKHFGTSTVQALVDRGLAEYTNYKNGRNGRFPIEITLKKANSQQQTANS